MGVVFLQVKWFLATHNARIGEERRRAQRAKYDRD